MNRREFIFANCHSCVINVTKVLYTSASAYKSTVYACKIILYTVRYIILTLSDAATGLRLRDGRNEKQTINYSNIL